MTTHAGAQQIDVHEHLWPASLVESLRSRAAPPMLRGWTLHSMFEAPFVVAAADHDVALREALDPQLGLALVSLSTPLGIEALPPDQARPLLQAWHGGAAELPTPFAAWAACTDVDPDLDALAGLFADGFVGLQIGAQRLVTPAALERCAPVLSLCAELNRPVFVHPGPAGTPAHADLPPWWAPVVDYSAQLQAAWWSWHVAGRALFPTLRICFAAGAGLAPLHHERLTARGGGRVVVDPDVYVETSSHGPQAVDALTRALGVDAIVLGSDRPYAAPLTAQDTSRLGDAAWRAISVDNPRRLLEGANR